MSRGFALALLTLMHCTDSPSMAKPAEGDDEPGKVEREAGAPDARARGSLDAASSAQPDDTLPPADASAADTRVPPDAAPALEDAGAPPSRFPAVTDVSAAGPYATKSYSNAGPGGNYTIQQPDPLGQGGVKHPLLTWGNGGSTTPGFYSLLPHLASHGFVVIAANTIPAIGAEDALGKDMLAGIDWLIAQNDVADSEYAGKLDTAHVAPFGYSMGGLATFTIVGDPRWTTSVHISGGNTSDGPARIAKAHAPMFWSCGESDVAQPQCQADFESVTTQSVVYGTLLGADHLGILVPPSDAQIRAAVTAWFRSYLMADQAWQGSFSGTDCGLCKDSATWKVLKKNYD